MEIDFFFSGVFRVDTCGMIQAGVAQILQHIRMIWGVRRPTLHPINKIKISGCKSQISCDQKPLV